MAPDLLRQRNICRSAWWWQERPQNYVEVWRNTRDSSSCVGGLLRHFLSQSRQLDWILGAGWGACLAAESQQVLHWKRPLLQGRTHALGGDPVCEWNQGLSLGLTIKHLWPVVFTGQTQPSQPTADDQLNAGIVQGTQGEPTWAEPF